MTEIIVSPRKRCSRCKRELPAKFPYYNRNKNKKSGFECHCRGCRHNWTDEEFQIEILRHVLLERGYRQCRGCEAVKLLSKFPKSKSCLGGRRLECLNCSSSVQRERARRPEIQTKQTEYRRREDVRARLRERESRPEVKAKKSEYDKRPERKAIRREQYKREDVKMRRRQYYERRDIREKVNEYNRERYRRSEDVRAQSRARRQNRRARELSLPEDFTAEHWKRSVDYFGGCCAVCGRLPGEQFTLAADHWVPLARGGATVTTNIVPLCHSRKGGVGGSCNRSKWHKDAHQWLVERFGKLRAEEIGHRILAYFEWVKKIEDGTLD